MPRDLRCPTCWCSLRGAGAHRLGAGLRIRRRALCHDLVEPHRLVQSDDGARIVDLGNLFLAVAELLLRVTAQLHSVLLPAGCVLPRRNFVGELFPPLLDDLLQLLHLALLHHAHHTLLLGSCRLKPLLVFAVEIFLSDVLQRIFGVEPLPVRLALDCLLQLLLQGTKELGVLRTLVLDLIGLGFDLLAQLGDGHRLAAIIGLPLVAGDGLLQRDLLFFAVDYDGDQLVLRFGGVVVFLVSSRCFLVVGTSLIGERLILGIGSVKRLGLIVGRAFVSSLRIGRLLPGAAGQNGLELACRLR